MRFLTRSISAAVLMAAWQLSAPAASAQVQTPAPSPSAPASNIPDQKLDAAAAALERVAGEVVRAITSRGPVAARLAKEAVRKGCDLTLDQGIRLEEDLYALLQTTTDRAEGVRAFLEKRRPLFKGA